jgi:uncharacterized protein YggU (UPF0235/DUF167 family)
MTGERLGDGAPSSATTDAAISHASGKSACATMTRSAPFFRIEGNSLTFWLKVKPKSPRERIKAGPGGELQLEVHAPPAHGEANAACRTFLAHWLRLPVDAVEIKAGLKSHRKLIRIVTPSIEPIVEELRRALAKDSGNM